MVDEGEKEDMLAPLDKRLRHLEITGGCLWLGCGNGRAAEVCAKGVHSASCRAVWALHTSRVLPATVAAAASSACVPTVSLFAGPVWKPPRPRAVLRGLPFMQVGVLGSLVEISKAGASFL